MNWDDYLNDDQIDYRRSIESIPTSQRCRCGWYLLGECPHCPAGKTLEGRLNGEHA